MAPVADTRTQTDAFFEQRQIRDANALLVQERDTILREISQWQPVLASIKAEIAAHSETPLLIEKLHGHLSTQLLEKRDALQRDIDQKTAKSSDLDAEHAVKEQRNLSLDDTIEQKVAHVEVLKASVEEWQQKDADARAAHADATEQANNELPLLLGEVEQARTHLASVKLEEEVLLENRRAEEIRLATKGRDLAIYEDRIRQAAAQLDPPMQIIL